MKYDKVPTTSLNALPAFLEVSYLIENLFKPHPDMKCLSHYLFVSAMAFFREPTFDLSLTNNKHWGLDPASTMDT